MNTLEEELKRKFQPYEEYYETLPENKKSGYRFLISKCPEKKEDVKILFLNLNPSGKDKNNAKTFNTKEIFWCYEDWGEDGNKDRIYFKRCLYWITKRYLFEWLISPLPSSLSYKDQLHREASEKSEEDLYLKTDPIPTDNILCAYYIPLRTKHWGNDEKRQYPKAEDKSKELWSSILSGEEPLLEPDYIFTTGDAPYDAVCEILGVKTVFERPINKENSLAKHPWTQYRFTKNNKTKIIGLPQLTHFRIFKDEEQYIEPLEEFWNELKKLESMGWK